MAIEFKMYIDGSSATSDQLDKIDEIVVEQAMDRAWEARLKIPICVTADGKWDGADEPWMKAFTRIRIEVNAGDGNFTPLIDGPAVTPDSDHDALPGKSMVTVVVHDDSALLNQHAKVEVVRGKTDSEIAKQIFLDAQLGGTSDIDDTPPQPDQTMAASVQRGTPMQYLRDLARRNKNWHAYVLPGNKPGQSIGCFKKDATETDGLPEMVLLGAERNIETFKVRNQAQKPSTVQGAALSIAHDQVKTSKSSYREASLLGDEPTDAGGSNEATTFLCPGQSDRVDLDSVTKGAAADSGYSLEATGAIVPFCYTAALSPYRVVLVKLSNSPYSGKYLITQVTHTLSRSIYKQSFAMKGNATSKAAGGSAGAPQPSASPSVSFNVQVGIF